MRASSRSFELMHGRKPCFWCRKRCEHAKLTRDHLVPLWALQLIPELPDGPGNIVKACGPCNANKGGMPPSLFFYVRCASRLLSSAQHEWQAIRDDIKSGHYNPALRARIVTEMTKDYPTKPSVARPELNGRPWKHAAQKKKRYTWVGVAAEMEIARRANNALPASSNGRTPEFGSGNRGSNP